VLAAKQIDDLVAFLSSCRTNQAPGCRSWSEPQSK
jgi:hypothetical protein